MAQKMRRGWSIPPVRAPGVRRVPRPGGGNGKYNAGHDSAGSDSTGNADATGEMGATGNWLKQIWGEFTRQHGDLAAGAVALFGLLSLIPLLLLAVWLYVAVVAHSTSGGGSENAWAVLRPRLEYLLTGSSAGGTSNFLLDAVHGVVTGRRTAGIVGLLGLAWSGSRVFNILTEALDEAWGIDRGRNILQKNLVSLGMVLVIGSIFLVSLGAALGAHSFIHLFSKFLGPSVADSAGFAASVSLNLLTSIALFVVVYKWAPNRRVPWKAALVGGILGGLVWAAFQQIFRFYLEHFSTYNRAYGTMGAFVILVLWAYYSAYILILGSVVSAVYSERKLGQRGPDASTVPGPPIKRRRGEEMAAEAKGR